MEKPKIPSDSEIEYLWAKYQTPDPVIAHCRKVAELALAMWDARRESVGKAWVPAESRMGFPTESDNKFAEEKGMAFPKKSGIEVTEDRGRESVSVNLQNAGSRELVRAAALLHDMVRDRRHHEEEGAKILREEGYPELAWMVRRHSDFAREEWEAPYAKETAILYLADKQVSGTDLVSIEERFARSHQRLAAIPDMRKREESLKCWGIRYQQAADLAEKFAPDSLPVTDRGSSTFGECKTLGGKR